MIAPSPGRVLRLAVIGWGLGDLAMGRTRAGLAWLVAEGVMLAGVAVASLLFADTSWYLLPFLLGMAFLLAWAGQAVSAYRRARSLQGAAPPASARSPATAVAWLTLPLLAWGTGFWLVAADAATPAAVADRFVSRWAEIGSADRFEPMADDPVGLAADAADALGRLDLLCRSGLLADDCATATENLLRDVRVRIEQRDAASATAVAEVVRYVRRPSTFLGIFEASELEAIPIEAVLTLELEAREAAFGAVRWKIVNAEVG